MAEAKRAETTWLWLAKMGSGLLVFTVLMIHLVVNHLVAEGGLMTYADIIGYLSNPWIVLMESTFLVIVVGHSLLGLRSILLDLNPAKAFLRAMDGVFVLLGTAAIIYGLWLMGAITSSGAA